jgi:cold-inducible RNA-binding protein
LASALNARPLVKDGFLDSSKRAGRQLAQKFALEVLSIRNRSFVAHRFSAKPLDFDTSLDIPFRGKGKTILMSTKLYVGNLSFNTSSQDLESMFAEAGTVQSANVVEDRDTGRSRGFAFVEMSTTEEAAAAITSFDGKEFDGRNLKVNEAKPRENRDGGGNGFRGGKSRW